MDAEVDYMGIHREICSKIKKRFTRKVNIAQKSAQLGQLRAQLKQQQAHAYAALFSIAIVRCEQAIDHKQAECDATIAAGRLFLEAEKDLHDLGAATCEEYLISAIGCFNQAIQMRCRQNLPLLAASLCLEVADSLLDISMDHIEQAISFLDRATELLRNSPLDALLVMESSSVCRLLTSDFTGCLTQLTDLLQTVAEQGVHVSADSSRLLGPYADLTSRCEVLRILLLLFLQPSGQHLRSEHSQVIEKFTNWDPLSAVIPTCHYGQELFMLLHSLVITVQHEDAEAAHLLQEQLWSHLTLEQNHILQLVLQQIQRCAEEDM